MFFWRIQMKRIWKRSNSTTRESETALLCFGAFNSNTFFCPIQIKKSTPSHHHFFQAPRSQLQPNLEKRKNSFIAPCFPKNKTSALFLAPFTISPLSLQPQFHNCQYIHTRTPHSLTTTNQPTRSNYVIKKAWFSHKQCLCIERCIVNSLDLSKC